MTRTITTAAELGALSVGSVVLDRTGCAHQHVGFTSEHPNTIWRGTDEGTFYGSNAIVRDRSPLTVLHDPSAPEVPVASDTTVEVYPFHERYRGLPALFHVSCSRHPEVAYCGPEAAAEKVRADHLADAHAPEPSAPGEVPESAVEAGARALDAITERGDR